MRQAAEFASGPRVIAEFQDHDGLLAALRMRKEQLELSGETLDDLAGLTARHVQKILGINPSRGLTRLTIGPLLQSLALKCIVIEDPEAAKRLARRWRKRNASFVRNGPRTKRKTAGR